MTRPDRGHRILPHTADAIIEAWGADVSICAEEAANGLIGMCVSGSGVDAEPGPSMLVSPGATPVMVEAILEDLVYLLDTSDLVPVAASVTHATDGGLELSTQVAPRSRVTMVGAAPKAVVMTSVHAGDPVRCRFIVDV